MWLALCRLTETFWWEGAAGDPHYSLQLTARAVLRSGEAAWDFNGSDFKCPQGWRLQNLSGQSAALLGCSHREQISPYVMPYVMFSVMPMVFCPPCGALWRACFHGSTALSAGGLLLGHPEAVSSLKKPHSISLSITGPWLSGSPPVGWRHLLCSQDSCLEDLETLCLSFKVMPAFAKLWWRGRSLL